MRTVLWLAVGTGAVSSTVILFVMGAADPFRDVARWITDEVQLASVFFVQSITVGEITEAYHGAAASPLDPGKKVQVLIVPGHQPDVGGTEFNGVYERDVVVDIALELARLLEQNSHYDVMVARTKTAWHPILQSYFDTHALEIDTFRQSQALQMANHILTGSILPQADQVYHNEAPSEAVLQLYGINKWASDNAYEITIHLHVNDYAGRRRVTSESYTGFAIYVPNYQYSNAAASKAIADALAVRLNAYHATSTLPKEDVGVVEDQELIAIGSNNSADSAAILVEYGYIYEPQFQDASVRSVAIAEYAFQTYLGLQDFFKDPVLSTYGSAAFPRDWSDIAGKENEHGPSIYALQAALHALGFYPPNNRTFSDCPISGRVGSCTRAAVAAYQDAKGLPMTGFVGPRTKEALSQDLKEPDTSPVTYR